MSRTRRYSIEIKRSPDAFLVLSAAADWNDNERRLAFGQLMRMSRMPNSTRLYWLQIKDQKGVVLLFNTMDWTDDDRRVGVAEICRLAGLPKTIAYRAGRSAERADKEL